MVHLGTKTITTDRLILRRLEVADAPAMYRNWASDEEVTKYLMWPYHKSVEDSESVIASWIPRYEDPEFYLWAIVPKENNEPIGTIAVVKQHDHIKMAHIGYCIGRAWWHQGIMSEALAGVMAFLFNEVGVNRIESRHDPRNPNSGKVMQKCGMRYEGTLRQGDHNNLGICDAAMYALLAEEYAELKKQQSLTEGKHHA